MSKWSTEKWKRKFSFLSWLFSWLVPSLMLIYALQIFKKDDDTNGKLLCTATDYFSTRWPEGTLLFALIYPSCPRKTCFMLLWAILSFLDYFVSSSELKKIYKCVYFGTKVLYAKSHSVRDDEVGKPRRPLGGGPTGLWSSSKLGAHRSKSTVLRSG